MQWRYIVNTGPTKGRIVDDKGETILELENRLKSSSFEKHIKQACRAVNSHDDLLDALKQTLDALFNETFSIEYIDTPWIAATKAKALAAIAKAQGDDSVKKS